MHPGRRQRRSTSQSRSPPNDALPPSRLSSSRRRVTATALRCANLGVRPTPAPRPTVQYRLPRRHRAAARRENAPGALDLAGLTVIACCSNTRRNTVTRLNEVLHPSKVRVSAGQRFVPGGPGTSGRCASSLLVGGGGNGGVRGRVGRTNGYLVHCSGARSG